MQADAPFIGGYIGSGDVIGIIPTLNATAAVAVTQDGQLARGFEALYTELELAPFKRAYVFNTVVPFKLSAGVPPSNL